MSGGKSLNEAPGLLLQIDELKKQVDRVNRALDAEKQKVKGLSDRVVVAEREVQSSTPIINDLETKIESAIKMSRMQPHKDRRINHCRYVADAASIPVNFFVALATTAVDARS